jgi:hypothetical protein
VCGLFASIAVAHAELVSSVVDGRVGRLEFRSVTPSGPTQLVRSSYPREGTVVAGALTVPPDATGRVAAMVIAHDAAALAQAERDVVAFLSSALDVKR